MAETEHLFISDVHLGAFSPETEMQVQEKLLALIRYATEHSAKMYILGDLFDYWMEYPAKKFIPDIGEDVLHAFESYNRKAGPALYITGNHDNWTFGHFAERGFDVEPDARLIKVGSHRVLLMHGDGEYGTRTNMMRPLFHRLLRSRRFINVYQKLLPPESGLRVMKGFSGFSKQKEYLNPKPLDLHTEQILRDPAIDVVLCGHDHVPRVKKYADGMYVNLGTFFHHGTMVRYIKDEFKLVIWKPETEDFIPFNSTDQNL